MSRRLPLSESRIAIFGGLMLLAMVIRVVCSFLKCLDKPELKAYTLPQNLHIVLKLCFLWWFYYTKTMVR